MAPRPGSQLRSEAQATCHTRPRCPTRLTRALERMRRHQRRCHMKLGCWKQRWPGRGRARVQGYEAPHVHAADSELLRQAPGHGAAQAVTAKHHAATQRRAQLATLANAGVQPAPSSSSTGQRRRYAAAPAQGIRLWPAAPGHARAPASARPWRPPAQSPVFMQFSAGRGRVRSTRRHGRPRPASPGTLREQSFSRNHEGCAGRTAIPAFTVMCVTRARYDILRLRQAALKCGTAQAPEATDIVATEPAWKCIQAAPLVAD